jgi:hypothetical protein
MTDMTRKSEDIKVFISSRDSTCDECHEELGGNAWITLADEGALCLSCADLDHLIFLPSGDAALTRRSRKHSTLSAVVLKWSKARKRYERQGLLVEEAALERAEAECLADEAVRARSRERAAIRRAELDREYVEAFAERVGELFPRCARKTARRIAEHACLKHSGRVGRTAAAKKLGEDAVRLSVIAHIRHEKTRYDTLLASGWERHEARRDVQGKVQAVLEAWECST